MSKWEVQFSDPRHAKRRKIFVFGLVLAVPLSFFIGYWMSRPAADIGQTIRSLQAQVAELEAEKARLQSEADVLKTGARLARQATEQSRQTIKLLESQIFEQQQNIAYYKGVVAPGKTAETLDISVFEVQPTEQQGLFRYKIMMTRLGKDDGKLTGQLKVHIAGQLNGKAVEYPLHQLSNQMTEKDKVTFSLRHFQSIPPEGQFAEMTLPEGFIPKQIQVRAEFDNKQKPLVKQFDWPE